MTFANIQTDWQDGPYDSIAHSMLVVYLDDVNGVWCSVNITHFLFVVLNKSSTLYTPILYFYLKKMMY